MRFHKLISTILHPIVIPTIGVMLYFLVVPNSFISTVKFTIVSFIFIATYIIPLLILIILKKIKSIKSYQIESIKERKIPISFMILIFYILGNTLEQNSNLRELGLLFFATSLGLFIIYLLFFLKIKASIHLLSLGITAGFFMVLSTIYSQSFIIIIGVLFILSGILASARLHLKAHTTREIYIGFFIGIASNLSLYLLL